MYIRVQVLENDPNNTLNEINNTGILSDINHTTVTTEQANKLISDISSMFTSSADTVLSIALHLFL
jgi:hypothetical protein